MGGGELVFRRERIYSGQTDCFEDPLTTYALRSFLLTLLLAPVAIAQAPGNRTYFGQDIYVAAGQEVHNATCFFCSIQAEGDVTGHALVVFGSLDLSGQMKEGATVIGGNAVVDSQARIGGDTVVLGGNAVYETDESLAGSAYVLGGHLSHVSREKGFGKKRISLSPMVSGVIGVGVLLLLFLVVAARVRVRRRVVRTPVA